ncbi:HNH endonuclease signature motif containing protein [Hamadaea sp. NPDC051192]|uniref:HNH endonuclease n=1 Tax=Hamadaea sp. NPDC051192 TaxID=3154940 RepID=UPI003421E108
MPNRIVRLFLQDAGRQYDINRGHQPFRQLTPSLRARFGDACAYCGSVGPLVEEHLVPMNRKDAGLHAWGNIVPACKACNDIKSSKAWTIHPKLDTRRRQAITDYIDEYAYRPDVTELRIVLERLYELSDRQTRALVEFGLVASRPYIAGLHTPMSVSPAGLVAEPPSGPTPI